MEDRVIENTDALSQFSYVRTFRRSGGSASEEAMRAREKHRHYVENVGSVGAEPCQLDLHSSTKINKAVTLSE